MITLAKLRWSNLFSYGENNEIDFTKNALTQIVGANGYGKSSIALILEEALYNKNSKGIKKADILNRNSKAKAYSIEVDFFKDDNFYEIKTVRGSTQTVKLFENGVDISSHTSTGTYSTIQSLIACDHKTFSQIVYQSSASSLEFLTATDGNRKKFLIELLNLSKYVDIGEVFKEEAKKLNSLLVEANTKIKSAKEWIEKYSNVDMVHKQVKEVPEQPRDLIEKVSEIKEQIAKIESTNKKIAQNNKYAELRNAIVLNPAVAKPLLDNAILEKKTILNKVIADEERFVKKMLALGHQCPTCMQDINQAKLEELINLHRLDWDTAALELIEVQKKINIYNEELSVWNEEQKKVEEYEKYHNLYDPKLQQTLLSKEELEETIAENEKVIKEITSQIKKITEENNSAVSHNAKIDVIKSQLEEMQLVLEENTSLLSTLSEKNNIYQILIKTFSPTGLVAYKIECLIKDLEALTNQYLTELSGGRFQLSFRISADKLNVVITDNGKDVEIYSLSSGERARVNTAALLGIRKLMQSLSNSRINLLILDETIENLDTEGKEKLVEILLNEEFLNTFIISHSFSHPLLERLYVTKENNMSRIENG